jgi:hypothetical protein
LKRNWREEKQFSSFAYRIEAVRILGLVQSLNHTLDLDHERLLETLDACLAAFFTHLPASQREAYRGGGDVDEMIFQAQMIVYL